MVYNWRAGASQPSRTTGTIFIRESVDSLCRDETDAPIIQYEEEEEEEEDDENAVFRISIHEADGGCCRLWDSFQVEDH